MKWALALLLISGASAINCTAEEECYLTSNFRCVKSEAGSPCTLDHGQNDSGHISYAGHCSCGIQTCLNLSVSAPSPNTKQYLVIGDSVSLGYFGTLKSILEQSHTWEVFHAPGNNDNTNWGNHCVAGWLGPNPHRWDVISLNWGLHDLAFPDNEHLSVETYTKLLGKIHTQLKTLVRPDTKLLWVTTTPVPTDPPPDPLSKKSCTLIPGRLESNVLRYNAAAAKVFEELKTCDMHKVITNHCGVGYSTCDIAQCAGPHFVGDGFPMLGRAMADCVKSAFSEQTTGPLGIVV